MSKRKVKLELWRLMDALGESFNLNNAHLNEYLSECKTPVQIANAKLFGESHAVIEVELANGQVFEITLKERVTK